MKTVSEDGSQKPVRTEGAARVTAGDSVASLLRSGSVRHTKALSGTVSLRRVATAKEPFRAPAVTLAALRRVSPECSTGVRA